MSLEKITSSLCEHELLIEKNLKDTKEPSQDLL